MKKLIINLINKIEMNRTKKPKTFKIIMITLYCIAPIEMLCLKLGILGYKKLNNKYSKKIQEDLK